jgi:predicted small lipoprotein YifL
MKHRITSPLFVLLITLAGSCALLAGCGQKGPLYLPEEAEQTEN